MGSGGSTNKESKYQDAGAKQQKVKKQPSRLSTTSSASDGVSANQSPSPAPSPRPDQGPMRRSVSGTAGETMVRPCDVCGEMRKSSNFGDGQWLCIACQLNHGASFAVRKPQKTIQVSLELPKPQPILRRGNSMITPSNGRAVASTTDFAGATTTTTDVVVEARKRGKCKTFAEEGASMGEHRGNDSGQSDVKPKLLRAQTSAVKGFQSGAEPEVETSALSRAKSHAEMDMGEAPKVPPAAARPLASGYSHGDRVLSLISRENTKHQALLELGQEGMVVGAATETDGGLRLLVQFPKGCDWWLSPSQTSTPSKFASQRAAGIHGFSWGAQVRALVTFLHPLRSSNQTIRLGDEGTVIGPSTVKGKMAVRFNGQGDWSVWPALVCKSETFDTTVAERLAGRLSRGDRVRCKGGLSGRRSADFPGTPKDFALSVADGEEGTVVGPGHSPGKVLVHFDADDRVWSVDPKNLASTASCI